MGMNSKSRIAGGTINPFSFIIGNPGVELGCMQATGATSASNAGAEIIGIAAEWTDQIMGTQQQLSFVPAGYPAATTGQALRVYEEGEDTILMVGSGFTVEPDNLLTSDASGNGIPITLTASGPQWVGARAIEAGLPGQPIRVSVLNYMVFHT
jgi:hypothetical protein